LIISEPNTEKKSRGDEWDAELPDTAQQPLLLESDFCVRA